MIREIESKTKSRMNKTIGDLGRELAALRTGRASIHFLDNITVNYYGVPTPLNQIATLHVPDPSLITVQPWEVAQIENIQKAVLASNLGLTPSNDGKIVRIPIPSLTEERRLVLAKHVGKVAEEHRTAIRNIRRDVNEELKRLVKEKEISEDMGHTGLEQIQKVTNGCIEQIDNLATSKEKEISEV